MTRIFTVLASTNALLLLISYALGVTSKLRDGIHHAEDSTYWYHFLIGISTLILTLFIHCILIFTYFLGTGRWVKEVKLAYDMPDEPLPKLTRELKRKVFPPALFAMLSAIATGAVGASAQVRLTPWELHAVVATVTLLINGWAYCVEYRCLRTNVLVLEEVMVEVDRIRQSRGLPPNAEALLQEDSGR